MISRARRAPTQPFDGVRVEFKGVVGIRSLERGWVRVRMDVERLGLVDILLIIYGNAVVSVLKHFLSLVRCIYVYDLYLAFHA